jgi:MFS family permease
MLMVGNALSTAFGGLLALAIAGIKSSNGYHSWRWIFIIEGCMTTGVTIIAYLFLPDWPETAKWLTSEEKDVLAQKSKCCSFELVTTLTINSQRARPDWAHG